MRLVRLATCAALAGSLLVVGTSHAATKPFCNLLADDKGDAQFLGQAPNDPNLDIIGGDVASDGKTVTTVLRLASFAASDVQSPLGRGYYVLFNAPGLDFPIYFNMQITPDLTRFAWGDLETLATGNGSYVKKGDATGVLDAAKGEIRVSVPLADLSAVVPVKKGTKLTNLAASATAVLGTSKTGGLVSTIDTATSPASYFAGAKSCVTPGV